MAEDDKIYIQRSDYSIADVEEQSPAGALKALEQFDWKGQEQGRRAGEDTREACLCLGVFGDEYFMEIAPRSDATADIYYVRTRPVEKKKLGIFTSHSFANDELVKDGFPLARAAELIDAYFRKDEQALRALLG